MIRVLVLLFIVISIPLSAQRKKQQDPPTQAEPKSVIETKVAGLKKYPGFFEFYYDEKNDKILMIIDKLDTDVLYVESLTAAVGSNDIGLDRNQLGKERVVRFEKRGPKILMVEPTMFYRAMSNNEAERNAVKESFAESVLWGFIALVDENGKVLVDATDFLIQDVHDVTGTLRNSGQGSYQLEKSRSAMYLPRTKNFPENTEFEVTLTFTGQPTGGYIKSVTPTPSALTVREHHSFVQLPDNNYTPRKFDPRAGYYAMSYYDYATPIEEPIEKRFITRHRLKKKDPSAAVSEAVEPIIYYMDPGAPEPIRSALMEGARWWNQAFEAAGYKDAFRVELLPADADPMDVRYNVINWVHRSTRGWSYGGGVTDPRTGEIIKGHVTLGSLRVRQDFLIAEGLLAPYDGKEVSPAMKKMALDRLKQLAAHEVGHTLGLSHAYSSSSEHLASVMDYPHPVTRLVNGKIDLSQAYDSGIGNFDKFAIAYGYQDFAAGLDVDYALENLVNVSLKSGLTFLSDQDARPAGGAHPYAHLWDNGSDAADELNHVLKVRALALAQFGEHNIKQGAPLATLEEVLVPMYFFHRYQVEAAVKSVGGVNYRYALRGDGQPVTEIVNAENQTKALDMLLKTVTPETLMIPEKILTIIPPRPIGYSRHRELVKIRTELTFDPLSAAEAASDLTFSLVLHPARANRLIEQHARNPKIAGLDVVIDKLVNASIKATPRPGYEGAIQMTIDQTLLNNMMKLSLSTLSHPQSRAIAVTKLNQLKVWLRQKSVVTSDFEWKSWYNYLADEIDRLQQHPEEIKMDNPLMAPPGQPIGSDDSDFCGY